MILPKHDHWVIAYLKNGGIQIAKRWGIASLGNKTIYWWNLWISEGEWMDYVNDPDGYSYTQLHDYVVGWSEIPEIQNKIHQGE